MSDVDPVDMDRAACYAFQPCDGVHQRRLAAARWPDQDEELALLHGKIDALERLLACIAIGLAYTPELESRHRSNPIP